MARAAVLLAVTMLVAVAMASSSESATTAPAGHVPVASPGQSQARLRGIDQIRHVVIIMQENRSFDSYFGTFRRAHGIPGLAGHGGKVPCLPDPLNGGCVKPFHDRNDENYGGPHGAADATADPIEPAATYRGSPAGSPAPAGSCC